MKNSEEHCRISQSRSWSLSVMYLSLLILITLRRLLLLPQSLDYQFPNSSGSSVGPFLTPKSANVVEVACF